MSYLQLVQPNLSAQGRIGYCLEYAENFFKIPHGGIPNAWTDWLGSKHPHLDRNIPPDVSVPMWYSYINQGVNLGHVTISVPGKGIYSSPWKQGTTSAVLTSIAEVEQIYGVRYVGWSEDISNIRVVEENMAIITAEHEVAMSLGMQGTQPQNAEQEQFIGKTADQATVDGNATFWSKIGQANIASLEKQIADLQKGQNITDLKPGTYKVN